MKKVIRLNENDLHKIVNNSIARILNEGFFSNLKNKVKGGIQGFNQGAESIENAENDFNDYVNMKFGAGLDEDKNMQLAYSNVYNAMKCLYFIQNLGRINEIKTKLKNISLMIRQVIDYKNKNQNGRLYEQYIDQIIKNTINESFLDKVKGFGQGFNRGQENLNYLNGNQQKYNYLRQGDLNRNISQNEFNVRNVYLAMMNVHNACKCVSSVYKNSKSKFDKQDISMILKNLQSIFNYLYETYNEKDYMKYTQDLEYV